LASDWVSLPVERGVPCALAAVALGALTVKALRAHPHALGTVAALAIVGMFDSVLQLPATLALGAVLLGAALPVSNPEPVRRAPAWALRAALVGGAVYATTLLAGFFLRVGAGFDRL